MARYDLYPFQGGLVIDLQSDIILIRGSRVVAPVLPAADVPTATRLLHPEIMVEGKPHVIATHLMAATAEGALKTPLANFAAQGDEITRALDVLFRGY